MNFYKTRSYSLTNLDSLQDDKNPNILFPAKSKMSQIKTAKKHIEKALNNDISNYEQLSENFLKKKEYFLHKEQSIVHELIKTQRLFEQEKSKIFCPITEILCIPEKRAAFFSDLYIFEGEILEILEENELKIAFQEIFNKKIEAFHDFFQLKLNEMQKKEGMSMLKEDLNGKIMQNIEYALAIEELEARLKEYESYENSLPIEKDDNNSKNTSSSSLNIKKDLISQEIENLTQNLKLQKIQRNQILLELQNFEKIYKENNNKNKDFRYIIKEIENRNQIKDLENSVKMCLSEKNLHWFIHFCEKVFISKKLLMCHKLTKEEVLKIMKEQNKIFNEVSNFPNSDIQIYEVISEGIKKNKHFKENLTVFLQFNEDLLRQIFNILEEMEQKFHENQNILERKYKLDLEFHEKETSIYFLSNQIAKKQAEISQLSSNVFKVKDILAYNEKKPSSKSEISERIVLAKAEICDLVNKRTENQKKFDELMKTRYDFDENDFNLNKKISELYTLLINEKNLIEKLQETQIINQKHPVFTGFYLVLMKNFGLLENKESVLQSEEAESLRLFQEKIDELKGDIEKVKRESTKEMCLMNGEMVRQQLKLEENKQKIKVLDKYLLNFKAENNIKTTQTTKNSEESVLDISAGENKIKKKNTTKNKSFSFVNNNNNKSIENQARYGNTIIELKTNKNKKSIKNYSICNSSIEKNQAHDFEANNLKTGMGSIDINKKSVNILDLPLQLPNARAMKEIPNIQNCNKMQKKINVNFTDIKEKIIQKNIEIFKTSLQKPRFLKIFWSEKKIEIWKKYTLAGKEKVALENCFLFADIKQFDTQAFAKKNDKNSTKEVLFKIEISSLGNLSFFVKNYQEGKDLKAFLKGVLEIQKRNDEKSLKALKKLR